MLTKTRLALEQDPRDDEYCVRTLLETLYSDVSKLYWRNKYGRSLPSVLGLVSNLAFSDDPELTAVATFSKEDVRSNSVRIGVRFFLDNLLSLDDLMFILQHEKMHLYLAHVYNVKYYHDLLHRIGGATLVNILEDTYINAIVSKTNDSKVSRRFYKDSLTVDGEPQLHRLLVRGAKAVRELVDHLVDNCTDPRDELAASLKRDADEFYAAYVLLYKKKKAFDFNRWVYLCFNFFRHIKLPQSMKKPATDMISILKPLIVENDEEGVSYALDGRLRMVKLKALEYPIDYLEILSSVEDCMSPEYASMFPAVLTTHATWKTIENMTSSLVSSAIEQPTSYSSSVFVPESLSTLDLFLVGSGVDLVSYQVPEDRHQYSDESLLVHLYVDVSGSMSKAYKFIPDIVRQLASVRPCKVLQFSTSFNCDVLTAEILEHVVSVEDHMVNVKLDGTVLITTGGTDFDIVGAHILKSGVRSVIMLTDCDGEFSRQIEEQLNELITSRNLTFDVLRFHPDKHGFMDYLDNKAQKMENFGATIHNVGNTLC